MIGWLGRSPTVAHPGGHPRRDGRTATESETLRRAPSVEPSGASGRCWYVPCITALLITRDTGVEVMRAIAAGCSFVLVLAAAVGFARAEGPVVERSSDPLDRAALKREVHQFAGVAERGLWRRVRFVGRSGTDLATKWKVLKTGYRDSSERERHTEVRRRLDRLVDGLAEHDAGAVRATLRHQRQQGRPLWLRDRAPGLAGYRGPRRAREQGEIAALIAAAVDANALVRIDYTRGWDGRRGEYLIAPRELAVSQQDKQYLQAVKLDRGRKHRRFRLDRIHEAWLTGEATPFEHAPTKAEVAFWSELERIAGGLATSP